MIILKYISSQVLEIILITRELKRAYQLLLAELHISYGYSTLDTAFSYD